MSDKERVSWETQMELNKTTGIMLGLLQNRLEELEKKVKINASNLANLTTENSIKIGKIGNGYFTLAEILVEHGWLEKIEKLKNK